MRGFHYLAVLLCALGVTWVLGQRAASAQQVDAQDLGDGIQLFKVRPDFYVFAGMGANVGVQLGSDGAVVVDSGDAAHADRLIAEIKKLTPRPIRYIINAGADADHVGGNEKVSKAGKSLIPASAGPGGPSGAGVPVAGASIVGASGVTLRMSLGGQPSSAWPTETIVESPRHDLYLNDQGIEVLPQLNAHADGDSLVFFRKSDVVMAGDVVDMRRFPVIDLENGGSVNGEIAALNRVIELAISSRPVVGRDAGTVVVPSHGRMVQEIDVVEYRDMVAVVRDRVESLMKKGKSLAQVKAANPTVGYTTRYGSDPAWTTDMFVEAVFKSLAASGSGRH